MATFKLNEEAEDDLERLYEHGILSFGLAQTDRYYEVDRAFLQTSRESVSLANY